MSSSVATSPVLFNSPPPGLKPAPLRIPDRKGKGSDDTNEQEFWGTYEHHASPVSEEEPHVTPPSNRERSKSLSQRRATSNKLDNLVSKFEILDAVNNADEEVPWLPRNSMSRPDAHYLSPSEPSSVPRRALGHSTSSRERSSTAEGSSDLSPMATRPRIPVRHSNIPLCSDTRTTTNNDNPTPVTPSKKPNSLIENSAFKSPKSLLDPAAFRVSQPDVKPVGTSPRQLPYSKSASKVSPVQPKSPRSFRSAIAALCEPSTSSEDAPHLSEAPAAERDPRGKTGCGGKPSVANLRQSFEQMSHGNGSKTVEHTPMKGKGDVNTFIQQPGSSNREKSFSADSGPKMAVATSGAPDQESSRVPNTPRGPLKWQPTDGLSRTPTYPARAHRTPVTGLPTNKGSRQRQAMLTKSKTIELSSVTSYSAVNYGETGAGEATEPVKANGLISFPLLDRVCVVHTSNEGETEIPCCSDGRPYVQVKPISHGKPAAMDPLEESRNPNAPRIQPIPVVVRPISRPNSKSDPTTRRTAKVADLRKLFDRPSHRGSSPTGFMSFARRQRPTVPSTVARDAARNQYLAEYTTTSSNESSSYNQTSAPELTTEISLNDFSCRFSHDHNYIKPSEEAEPSTSVDEETRLSFSSPRAPLHVQDDTDTETEQDDSPLKRRIKHFEHLQFSSNPKGLAYGRAKSHDTNLHAAFKASSPEKKPSKVKNGQWLRERGASTWRRISSSLNFSTDGGNDTSNVLYRGASNLEKSLSNHRDDSFGFSLHRMSTPFHFSLVAPHNTPTHYRQYSSEASHEAMIAELKSHSSYLSRAKSSPTTRRPKHLLPLYAARKSRAAIRRFTSSSDRSSDTYNFGLDGTVESKPSRDGESRLFTNPNQNIESEDLQDLERIPTPVPLAPVTSLPTSEQLAKKTVKDAKKASKEKERETKAAAKAAAKEMKAKEKGKRKTRFVSLGSSRRQVSGRKPTPHPNTLESNSDIETDDGDDGGNTKPSKKQRPRERSWGKITASGFMVRQAKVDELHQPKPQRPGQVKKIVNMYKEKSSSLLRIVSGNQSSHNHAGGGTGGGGGGGESSHAAGRHQPAAAGGSSRRRRLPIFNTDGEGFSDPGHNTASSRAPAHKDATGARPAGGGKYNNPTIDSASAR
ncbi:hypothetical protein PG996_011574 [Apiospora saccharicola]|uniref:Uncharacterized protein n=1 Tax=Apiospora saccharicola TaxID=335842 RepID=A0ABR1UG10_9PEZI